MSPSPRPTEVVIRFNVVWIDYQVFAVLRNQQPAVRKFYRAPSQRSLHWEENSNILLTALGGIFTVRSNLERHSVRRANSRVLSSSDSGRSSHLCTPCPH